MNDIPEKKKSIKGKVYAILVLLCIGLGVYGYYWVKENNALRVEAQDAITRAEQYDVLKTSVMDEGQRCENFIANKQGDFGSFEYCKRFIQWVSELNMP